MKAELTRILWTWGPVTKYQINLAEIDSSGDGASDAMEVIAVRRQCTIDGLPCALNG